MTAHTMLPISVRSISSIDNSGKTITERIGAQQFIMEVLHQNYSPSSNSVLTGND